MSIWGAHRELGNQNAFASVASGAGLSTVANFSFNTGNVAQDTAKITPALEQSASGLKNIQGIRTALAAQIDNPAAATPAASGTKADPSNPMSFFNPKTLALAGAGIVVGGPIGAGMVVASAAIDAVNFIAGKSGAQHAGLTHAAMGGGKSEFKSLTSEKGKKGDYVDVLGGVWGDDGVQQMATAASPAINPKLQIAAASTVDRLGKEEVEKQLGQTSSIERRLLQQAGSAMDFAEKHGEPSIIAPNNKPVAAAPTFG